MTKKTPKPKAPATIPQKLAVEYRPVEQLKPDPRNARKHSPQQIAELRASLRQFGFTNPILLRPDGTIGAGHGRFEAAKAEGIDAVPTITLNLSEKQWRAYAIADNKIPLGATWDTDILKVELEQIQLSGLDTVGLGFETLQAELLPPEPLELVETGRTGTRISQTIIQFNIVFDDEDQQGVWFKFVRDLKAKYPGEESLGARLALVLPKVQL